MKNCLRVHKLRIVIGVILFCLSSVSAIADTINFEGVPHKYNFYGENGVYDSGVNLNGYYPGVTFGPTATILETNYYWQFASYYPPHSGVGVFYSHHYPYINVVFDEPVSNIRLWYTTRVADIFVDAYSDSAMTNLLGKGQGYINSGISSELRLDFSGIRAIKIYSPGALLQGCVVDDLSYTYDKLTLTKVGIYYQHDSALSGYPGYPTTDTPVTIRAIVWAKDIPNGVEKPYTQENWAAGSWNNPGVDGATVNFNPQAQSLPAISEWPNNWPQIDFEWKVLFNQANTKNTTGYNKNYEEKEYGNPFWSGGWGYDNTLPRGTWRFKVKAILNKGTPEEQSVDSLISNNNNLAKEYATRVSVLDNNLSVIYGLNYLKWLTVYLAVPYEWGGHWFGGKEGQNVGGADTYDDYGIDCSGLVSNGARWAGFNWGSYWRATTRSLADGLPGDPTYYSSIINEKLLAPGDILNRVTHYIQLPNGKKKKLFGHVVSIYKIKSYKPDGTPDRIFIISAEGSPQNRVLTQEKSFSNDYKNVDYFTRRLTQH